MTSSPTVTVAIPVLNEEAHIDACLEAVASQTYPAIVEILVVDGGSRDRTRDLAKAKDRVRVLDNARRIQAAALNIALAEAEGELFVRVDGHCVIHPEYVERCVAALSETGAVMVGGGMTPISAGGWVQRSVAAAMTSSIGAGPARFHVGGRPGWVDTVYLGAFRTSTARALGGYAEDVGVNEDAELAHRLRQNGGIWFDPTIRSTYTPRASLPSVVRQFYRYGRGRAATLWRHPGSLAPRQAAAPALVLGLLSPWRRVVAVAYGLVIGAAAAKQFRSEAAAAPGLVLVLPAMHLSWGSGFLLRLAEDVSRQVARRART